MNQSYPSFSYGLNNSEKSLYPERGVTLNLTTGFYVLSVETYLLQNV